MLASEMVQTIRDHGFDDLTDAQILGMLNDTYYDVCGRELWPFLEAESDIATVANTATLTMPTDFDTAMSLVNLTTGDVLIPERRDNITRRYASSLLTSKGAPSFYYFLAGTIYLFSIPDKAYTLRLTYLKTPVALTSVDTPIFSVKHHRVLVLGALTKAYAMEDDTDLSSYFATQYEDRIQKMREDLWIRQVDKPELIVDVFDYDY